MTRKVFLQLLLDAVSASVWVAVLGPACLAGGAVGRWLFVNLPWYWAFGLLPVTGFAAMAGLLGATAIVSAVLPRCEEGEFPFPNHRMAIVWTARLVLHRILYMPVISNIIYASPVLRWILLRLLGAKVPFDMTASSDVVVLDPGLVEIGPGTMLGGGTWVSCHYIDETKIVLRKTKIGANVNVFIRSVIFPGAVIEDDVTLGIETLVANDVFIGEGTYVGMQCMIAPKASIGRGAVIGHHVLVNANAKIGDYAVIETGAIVPTGAVVGEGERYPPR